MRQLLLLMFLVFGALAVNAQAVHKQKLSDKKGVASYYHDKFEGRKTATGEVFDNTKFTAASNRLKLGTYVKVTNLGNGNIAYVRINDRMAVNNPRLIDMAHIAAEMLDYIEDGTTKVKVEIVTEQEGKMGILAESNIHRIMNNEL